MAAKGLRSFTGSLKSLRVFAFNAKDPLMVCDLFRIPVLSLILFPAMFSTQALEVNGHGGIIAIRGFSRIRCQSDSKCPKHCLRSARYIFLRRNVGILLSNTSQHPQSSRPSINFLKWNPYDLNPTIVNFSTSLFDEISSTVP
jgi:hypothetical protein